MSKYNVDDAWDDIEDFYGDDLETNDEEFVNRVNAEITKDSLTFGYGDPVEYVKNIELDLVDENGTKHKFELVGRIDIRENTYVLVHRIDDPDPSSLNPLKAWDNEYGQMMVCNIEDPNEYKEVAEMVEKLLKGDPNAKDIPGGGVQWND